MPAHQSAQEFAHANGFASYEELLSLSRHVSFHDGGEHFVAITPDGRELIWNQDDVDERPQDRQPPLAT